MKLHQHENYDGNDGPGTRRDHTYYVQQLQMTDTDGTEIGKAGFKDNSQDAAPIECGDGKPFMWKTALPNEMGITPEAVNDYIQFTNGPISWPSSQSEGAAGCKVELWNTQQDPVVSSLRSSHQVPPTDGIYSSVRTRSLIVAPRIVGWNVGSRVRE